MAGKAVAKSSFRRRFRITPNPVAVHACVVNYSPTSARAQSTDAPRSAAAADPGAEGHRPCAPGFHPPQWRKGGIALGPKPRSYRYTLNKKLKGLRSNRSFPIRSPAAT
ncbi:MAG: 50S ribosomal protein L4 [Christensenellales bacterium]